MFQVTNHMSTLEGDAVSKLDSVYKKTTSTATKQHKQLQT